MDIRVVLSTNPKEKIKNAKSLLPDEKMLKDENMEITTELLRISPLNVSEDLLAYLRSVLMMKNYEGEDKSLIMVSSPRIIDFELLVLDFAI